MAASPNLKSNTLQDSFDFLFKVLLTIKYIACTQATDSKADIVTGRGEKQCVGTLDWWEWYRSLHDATNKVRPVTDMSPHTNTHNAKLVIIAADIKHYNKSAYAYSWQYEVLYSYSWLKVICPMFITNSIQSAGFITVFHNKVYHYSSSHAALAARSFTHQHVLQHENIIQ